MPLTTEERLRLALEEDERYPAPKFQMPEHALGYAKLIANEDLVLSGTQIFEKALRVRAPELRFKWQFENGGLALGRQTLCIVEGTLAACAQAERVALRIFGALCGISTLSRCYSAQTEGTDASIFDSAVPLPFYRDWFDQAVLDGGAKSYAAGAETLILRDQSVIEVESALKKALTSQRFTVTGSYSLDQTKQIIKAGAAKIGVPLSTAPPSLLSLTYDWSSDAR